MAFLATSYWPVVVVGGLIFAIVLIVRYGLLPVGMEAVDIQEIYDAIGQLGVTHRVMSVSTITRIERWKLNVDVLEDYGNGQYWCAITKQEA